jgi:hypothetical protein
MKRILAVTVALLLGAPGLAPAAKKPSARAEAKGEAGDGSRQNLE